MTLSALRRLGRLGGLGGLGRLGCTVREQSGISTGISTGTAGTAVIVGNEAGLAFLALAVDLEKLDMPSYHGVSTSSSMLDTLRARELAKLRRSSKDRF